MDQGLPQVRRAARSATVILGIEPQSTNMTSTDLRVRTTKPKTPGRG